MRNLPDIGKSMQLFKLSLELPYIDHPSIVAAAWRTGPVKQVAKEIHDQLKDNRLLVLDIVGQNVVTIVDKIYS